MGRTAITRELAQHLREQFVLDWNGIHGGAHWARVRENGLELARETCANVRIVELFAFLHDSRRASDGMDDGHGARAAELATELNGRLFYLDAGELELLVEACQGHSDGRIDGDITVQTCWDADRLDLGRVGVRPSPDLLCTAPARESAFIEWAHARALNASPKGQAGRSKDPGQRSRRDPRSKKR